MKGRKPDSGRTKTAYQTKEKEATVPDTQPNPRKDELGNMVPGIQPIAKPDVGTQPVADTQPADNPQPAPDVQPEATPQPEPSGADSSE